MAFVYRKQKNEQPNLNKSPGPAEYHTQVQNRHSICSANFNGKVPRKLWEISSTPGPGQYDLNNQNLIKQGSHVLFGDSNSFCITDSFYNKTNGCSSNFKSKSKRLVINKESTPGPGQYQVKNLLATNKMNNSKSWQKPTKLTKYLFEETKKQNNKIDQQFVSFQLKKQVFEGDIQARNKQQKVNINDTKCNYKSVFNSKVQRKIISRPQTAVTVGPGSYNISEQKQILKKSFKNKKIQQKDDKNKQNEDRKDNIGPGYYTFDTSSLKRPQTSQSKGIACFGSKQSRFCYKFALSDKKIPGPQTYFMPNKKIDQQMSNKKIKKVPFNSAENKDQLFSNLKPSTISTEVSPCTYNPKNDFNQLLKKNFVKGTIGNFGSSVQRFKQYEPKQQKNSSQPLFSMITSDSAQKIDNKIKKISKSKKIIKKSYSINKKIEIDERPLSYDTNSKTIGKKFQGKKQIEAPFLTASERFCLDRPDFQSQILEKIRQQRQKSILVKGNRQGEVKKIGKLYKSSSKNGTIIGNYINIVHKLKSMEYFINENCIQNENSGIGPQTYNPAPIGKKQFNILFQQ